MEKSTQRSFNYTHNVINNYSSSHLENRSKHIYDYRHCHKYRIQRTAVYPCEKCNEPITFRREVLALSGEKIPLNPADLTRHYCSFENIRKQPVLSKIRNCNKCQDKIFYNEEKEPIEVATRQPHIYKVKAYFVKYANVNLVEYQPFRQGRLT